MGNILSTFLSTFGNLFHSVFQEPIYNILMVIYGLLHNVIANSFWLAIVIMTLLVRTAMIPLIFKQLQSSKAMQEIGPEIQKIQREYRSEPQVMQQKMSALYKANNVNPYASCLPLIVQLPFIYGLYGAFNSILRDKTATAHSLNDQLYPFVRGIFGPNGLTHFPDTHFFSITLAQPDPTHILPILAALLTFIQLRMTLKRNAAQSTAKPKAAGAPDPNAATMKMMQYIMPLFTLFIGLSFPSGLALYWIVTTGYSIAQQYFFNGRNWGGLMDGIRLPFLAAPAPALVAGSVVDGSVSAPYRSRHARPTADEATSTNGTGNRNGASRTGRLLPAAREDTLEATANGTKPSNGSKPSSSSTNGTATNGSKPVTRPNTAIAKPATGTRTPTTPLKTAGKKDAVRLVTPQSAGASAKTGTNGNNGAVVAPRVSKAATVAPRITTSTKPKSSSTAARARKKGR